MKKAPQRVACLLASVLTITLKDLSCFIEADVSKTELTDFKIDDVTFLF